MLLSHLYLFILMIIHCNTVYFLAVTNLFNLIKSQPKVPFFGYKTIHDPQTLITEYVS